MTVRVMPSTIVEAHGRRLIVQENRDGMAVLAMSAPHADTGATMGLRLPLSDDERRDLIRALGGIVDPSDRD